MNCAVVLINSLYKYGQFIDLSQITIEKQL